MPWSGKANEQNLLHQIGLSVGSNTIISSAGRSEEEYSTVHDVTYFPEIADCSQLNFGQTLVASVTIAAKIFKTQLSIDAVHFCFTFLGHGTRPPSFHEQMRTWNYELVQ